MYRMCAGPESFTLYGQSGAAGPTNLTCFAAAPATLYVNAATMGGTAYQGPPQLEDVPREIAR